MAAQASLPAIVIATATNSMIVEYVAETIHLVLTAVE